MSRGVDVQSRDVEINKRGDNLRTLTRSNISINMKNNVTLREFTPNDLVALQTYTKIKKDDIVNSYMYNGDFSPKYVLELVEGDQKYLWCLSNKLTSLEHDYVVGYCNVMGHLKVRLFRKSNSEGRRRAGLGKESAVNGSVIVSKGESINNANYEATTKVDYKISSMLDKIPEIKIRGTKNDPNWFNGTTEREIHDALIDEMSESIKIDKFFGDYHASSSCGFFAQEEINTVKEKYRNLEIQNLDLSNMKIIGCYTYNHDYLRAVKVDICSAEWNGKPINIHFARAIGNKPDKVRVENVEYTNAKINSFGVRGRQINTAPLTVKPIEYESQCPKDMAKGHETFGSYVDIRDLYQETPIIAAYKKKFLNA